ncbi:MAG: SDR family oxidoreductase [Gemmatimonadaceae bacterium]
MITVVGGSGMLGKHVCRELIAGGHSVRVMSRHPERAAALQQTGVSITRGDLRDPSSLDAALSGSRVVISASHAMLGGRGNNSETVDDAGQRALIDTAKRAGVEHFVFVSVLGASPDHPIDFWRTKWRTEQYLRNSGLPFTIIRPAAFMDLHAYELLGKAVLENKRVVLSGAGTSERNLVAAEDVARVIALHVTANSPRGEIIELGGPENLSALQIVQAFERFGKQKAKPMHLPLPLLRGLSVVIGLFHRGVGRVLRTAVMTESTNQSFDGAAPNLDMPFMPMTLEQWMQKNCRHPQCSENPPHQPVVEA